MHRKIFLLIILLSLTSCHKEWVFRPKIQGVVIDEKSKKTIIAVITTIPVEGEQAENITTNSMGFFELLKISSNGWTFIGMEKTKGPPVTNKLIIYSKGYKLDTLDFTNFSARDNKIDLGNIELKK